MSLAVHSPSISHDSHPIFASVITNIGENPSQRQLPKQTRPARTVSRHRKRLAAMTAECEELVPPWLKSDDLQVRTPIKLPRIPQPPALPNTSWMLILEERRRATEERLGPKADYPKPRTKLRGRSPRVPKEDSEDWSREASTLDRRSLARLLRDLKDRLAREQKMTSATEDRNDSRRFLVKKNDFLPPRWLKPGGQGILKVVYREGPSLLPLLLYSRDHRRGSRAAAIRGLCLFDIRGFPKSSSVHETGRRLKFA
eukprot:s2670_g2.t1